MTAGGVENGAIELAVLKSPMWTRDRVSSPSRSHFSPGLKSRHVWKVRRRQGLLEDDKELDEYMRDAAASGSGMPREIHQLLPTILVFNLSIDSLALWEAHKASLAEDFPNRERLRVPDL
ncbi:hypothetical protein LOD99_11993 [Oopsacas minuta]|uniref:Uncharacterized protein n=1 Tax=Oopsacas minuta TaxID=111878 RepID=A0AAV7JIB0_9METZ|nr:hypothetical protein LOD99_11993 [Oopsacas minuta]